MTVVPDWNQQELRSPLRPASVCVVLGPAGTTPDKAEWKFEFNVYAMDQLTGPAKRPEDESIPKGSRALLWFGGRPFPKYQHAVVHKGWRLSTTDELKTLSVVFRPYSEEKDPNSLLYVRKKPGVQKGHTPGGIGYLKVVQGYHYYLNVTFAAGSNIAQKVGLHSWRPIVYLTSKRPGREENDFITGSRQFTNFVTNWAQGVEINPDDREQKGGLDALLQDRADEEMGKIMGEQTVPYIPYTPDPLVPRGPMPANTEYHPPAAAPPGVWPFGPNTGALPSGGTSSGSGSGSGGVGGSRARPLSELTAARDADAMIADAMIAHKNRMTISGAGGDGRTEATGAMHPINTSSVRDSKFLGWNSGNGGGSGILVPQEQAALAASGGSGSGGSGILVPQEQAALAASGGSGSGGSGILVPQEQAALAASGGSGRGGSPSGGSGRGGSGRGGSGGGGSGSGAGGWSGLPTPAGAPPQMMVQTLGVPGITTGLLPGPAPLQLGGVSEYPAVPTGALYDELSWELRNKPPQHILLPLLDVSQYHTDLSLDPHVERFVPNTEAPLVQPLEQLEFHARAVATEPKDPACDPARQFLSCLSAVNQLTGWQHVQSFMHNPKLYIEKTKNAQRIPDAPPLLRGPAVSAPVRGSMDDFQTRGQLLIKRVAHRLEWFMEMARQAARPFDPDLAVRVLAADKFWAQDASAFMKEAESKVTDMLARNQDLFQQFRALQRHGVQWPHSAALRRQIEDAKFVFRPMMIKRDRCVCETCGQEVNGWRPWHDPWHFHDYARHPPSFKALADQQRHAAAIAFEQRHAAAIASAASPGLAPSGGSASAAMTLALSPASFTAKMTDGKAPSASASSSSASAPANASPASSCASSSPASSCSSLAATLSGIRLSGVSASASATAHSVAPMSVTFTASGGALASINDTIAFPASHSGTTLPVPARRA
jgi:Inhibitor of Apoptosis domain